MLQKIWKGACLDTEAQKTVIDLIRAFLYCWYMHTKLETTQINTKFKFIEDQRKSPGSMPYRILVPDHKMITELADIVKDDAPFRLHLLYRYKFNVNNIENCLCSTKRKLKTFLTRKNGHNYLERSRKDFILYTNRELFKVHR